jgi:general secretion pathway protein K
MKTVANERGMVLLMVLLVVTLLAVLLSEFAFSTLVDLRLAETFRDSARGYYLAKGGITVGRTFLILDKNGYDAPNDPAEIWGQGLPSYPVGDGYISISVEELSGKLNLNRLVLNHVNINPDIKPRFLGLCDELGLPNGDELVDSLVDWLDDNAGEEANGAESQYYLGLEHPYQAKNGPLDTLDELAMVKGFDAETIKLLEPYVTLFGNNDDKININTASRELLLADLIRQQQNTPAEAEHILEGIMARRDQGAIKTTQELTELAVPYPSFATTNFDVKSTAFLIVADAEVNDGRRTFSAVVDHDGKVLQQKVD